jgi:hypothetical protein
MNIMYRTVVFLRMQVVARRARIALARQRKLSLYLYVERAAPKSTSAV